MRSLCPSDKLIKLFLTLVEVPYTQFKACVVQVGDACKSWHISRQAGAVTQWLARHYRAEHLQGQGEALKTCPQPCAVIEGLSAPGGATDQLLACSLSLASETSS